MAEKKRSFTQVKKQMTPIEFDNFCKKITKEYANSSAEFARTYFCNKYDITISCFYKILEYSVTKNLVEDIIVNKMRNKAVANQNLQKKGAGGSTRAKYAKMYAERCKYIASTFSKEEINRLAIDFGDNPDISKGDFAPAYGVSSRVIDEMLVRAIEQNIADDRTVDAIEKRSIDNAKVQNLEMTKEHFAKLRKKRQSNQKEITLN